MIYRIFHHFVLQEGKELVIEKGFHGEGEVAEVQMVAVVIQLLLQPA
jgi:hypothetical protein